VVGIYTVFENKRSEFYKKGAHAFLNLVNPEGNLKLSPVDVNEGLIPALILTGLVLRTEGSAHK
jgi:hypothetical protein